MHRTCSSDYRENSLSIDFNLSSFSNMGINLRPQFSESQLAVVGMSRIVYKSFRLALNGEVLST